MKKATTSVPQQNITCVHGYRRQEVERAELYGAYANSIDNCICDGNLIKKLSKNLIKITL